MSVEASVAVIAIARTDPRDFGCWTTVDAQIASLVIPLHLPHGASLISVTVYLKGQSGHTDLPATMPIAKVRKKTAATAAATTVLATATDASASVGDYEADHSIVLDMSGAPPTSSTWPLPSSAAA